MKAPPSMAGLAIALAVSFGGIRAWAQNPDCDTLPNPLYIQSGDTQQPLLKALGRQLRDHAAHPITLVYITAGSCTNVDAVYNDTPITTTPFYVPSTAEDAAWDPSMAPLSCNIPVEGVPIDVGISATFVDSCNLGPPPADIGLITGPIQAYLFATPKASNQRAITAEEGYFTFGFGSAGQVDPWDDESLFFIRTTTKSTLLTTMAAIGVPVAKAKGTPFDKSSEVVNALIASADPERSIGIVGAEIYDKNRDTLEVLAFKAFGQRYAYYPDKTATSFDKQNVRDGHYTVWSPTVYMTRVDGQGAPIHPDAAYLIDLVLGKTVTPTPPFESLETVIAQGIIPDCAMKVQRPSEGANLSRYTPAEPCHCYYESQVGALGDGCIACSDDDACNGGRCRKGFCEAS